MYKYKGNNSLLPNAIRHERVELAQLSTIKMFLLNIRKGYSHYPLIYKKAEIPRIQCNKKNTKN